MKRTSCISTVASCAATLVGTITGTVGLPITNLCCCSISLREACRSLNVTARDGYLGISCTNSQKVRIMRIHTSFLAAILACCSFAHEVRAQGQGPGSLQFLLDGCNIMISGQDRDRRQTSQKGYCAGYVNGLMESWADNPPRKAPVCFPRSITTGQAAKVLVRWADHNPQFLHLTPIDAALAAFSSAFPCRNPQPMPQS
jgi:hypothetical protein